MTNKKQIVADDKRTTMNISLAAEDKKFLKVYAIEHDTTVAALIHEFVESLLIITGRRSRLSGVARATCPD